MTWTCEQTEARLSDYLDGVLTPVEMADFTAHVPSCMRCAPLLGTVSALVTHLHAMDEVPVPPRLVYAILDNTLGPRELAASWFRRIRHLASLRFAYGTLSVAATLIIFVSATGFNWRHPKLADLRPAMIYNRVDSRVHVAYGRTAKFVNDLRVVNEIQSRLRDENDLRANPESTVPESSPQKQPGSTDGSKPAPPRQQNRANDLARQIEVMAMELPGVCGGRGAL